MKNFSRRLLKLLLIVLAVSFLYLSYTTFTDFQVEKNRLLSDASGSIDKEVKLVADKINRRGEQIKSVGNRVAETLALRHHRPEEIIALLDEVVEQHPSIGGIGVHFLSLDGTDRDRNNLPFYRSKRTDVGKNPCQLVPVADIPISHVCSDTGSTVISGRVVIDVLRKDLIRVINSGRYGAYAFAFLVDSHGRYIYHPEESNYQARKTLFQTASERNLAQMRELGFMAISQQAGKIELRSSKYGLDGYLYAQPIGATGWSLGVMSNTWDIDKPSGEMQRNLMKSSAYATLAFIFISLLTLAVKGRLDESRMWKSVALVSLSLLFGILCVWAQVLIYYTDADGESFRIFEMPVLRQFQEKWLDLSESAHLQPPVFVPTGIFIQSVDFKSAVDVAITGYIWQKYPAVEFDEINAGVILPQAVDYEFARAYQRESGNDIVIGWSFSATLREDFNHSLYPFERENIHVQMWHKNFDKNIILIPDFESFSNLRPGERPGIEKDLILPGWKINESFFNYSYQAYNTNFGIADYQGRQDFPELFFNIGISRRLLDPFISIMLPLFVVLILTFILMLTVTRDSKVAMLLGFDASTLLSVIAALFFVVIFAHIDLRHRLAIETIMYLDYYYFAVYLIFLVISINSLLFASSFEFRILNYKDNLIPKLLFWPMTMCFLYIVTLWVFFPWAQITV